MSRSVSREQYFEVAFELLPQAGFKGLNIGLMCRELGVTSGSFYHHFGSWDGFVAAFLSHWERLQGGRMRAMAFGAGDVRRDLDALRELTLGLPHAAEAAIRAWSDTNEVVRASVIRVDQTRFATLAEVTTRAIGDAAQALVIASAALAMLVGYQQMLRAGEEFASVDTLIEAYNTLLDAHIRSVAETQQDTGT
jgi:AcrR family transcriptional regulator